MTNGLLLRRDIHGLFDRGYVTVTPEWRFEVSRRVKEEFENGRDYYAMHGRVVEVPKETWAITASSPLGEGVGSRTN